jgi:hypothetical protein
MWYPKIYLTRGEDTIHHTPSINTLKNVVNIIYTRYMMDSGIASSEVDLGLPHSIEYLY